MTGNRQINLLINIAQTAETKIQISDGTWSKSLNIHSNLKGPAFFSV